MPDPVANASPLVVLARAGLLDLLRLQGDRILVPKAVADEVRVHSDDAAAALDNEAWIMEVPQESVVDVVAAWDLGSGESAVLSWAVTRPGTVAVIDDFAARKCAESIGVQVRGTLGLALLAKRKGHVPEARLLIEQMRRAGLYLSDAVIRDALSLVGE